MKFVFYCYIFSFFEEGAVKVTVCAGVGGVKGRTLLCRYSILSVQSLFFGTVLYCSFIYITILKKQKISQQRVDMLFPWYIVTRVHLCVKKSFLFGV